MCISTMGFIPTAVTGEDETDILNITVGESTKLSNLVYQNTASVAVSRTGVVAAFYPKPGTGPNFYRTSTDLGRTWSKEMDAPGVDLPLAGGTCNATLRDGGVLKFLTTGSSFKGEAEFRKSRLEGEYIDGWFMMHSTFAWFNDNFTKYEIAPVQVYMPDAVTTKQTHIAMTTWPVFSEKMIQLPNGDLLVSMQGVFKGDSKSRTIICVSSDRGHKWRYYATVAYDPKDPNPDLPGQYLGYCEPTIAMLSNGKMICVMRTQFSAIPNEYKPMAVCWSNDLGKTWTKPTWTQPHLMNISPTLAALDNGVVACQYGRPGFHIVFSLDDGHTWQDRVSFSHMTDDIPGITGQFDMIKVGPNNLVAIGSDKDGVKVWPLSVERIKVSPSQVSLTGQVLDEKGRPVAGARVERSPNRYAADDWLEHETELDHWKAAPKIVGGIPLVAFRSIQEVNNHPIVHTDAKGRFRFDDVKLGEYILIAEADGLASQHRHIKVEPQSKPQEFRLKAGRLVRNRVLDDTGRPIVGSCVVLNHWHMHTDANGFFHWSVEAPLPQQVSIRVNKRYSAQIVRSAASKYETVERTVSFSQLESQPIILKMR